ncbi:ribonuclease III [Ignatzschineria rhizosphaerae]|uniref:Ribonuclease 3 n=1 Tax=Ignatzschineria rhizosphaerae TaxID=2923279 RepID=A0ABY3WX51_9GAMM|nr:ribonuclease III [Ignatzschineria rhizosphaerae]UNM95183.1 ribonuclease III [Ignatzschineria rhizosphaerae]
MQQLEKNLNYTFMDKRLLKQAFVHRSYSQDNNERLEYLGDGCLNFIIAEALYHKLPDANEGELSQLRAHLVKEDTLAEIALKLNLNQFLILSLGEKNNEGEFRPSTLSDCLEALFGALFLDSDFETTRLVILSLYEPYFQSIIEKAKKDLGEIFKSPKSRLQEKLQALNREIPTYDVIDITGRDHEKVFKVLCTFESHKTIAEGTTKKRAEQRAAELMLEKI